MESPVLYKNCNSNQSKDTKNILEEHLSSFQWGEGETILDIGCGPGNVTHDVLLPMLPKDSTVIACDKSQAMVDHGNECYYKPNKLIFMNVNIEDKNCEKHLINLTLFDKILSFYCLHWIMDHRQAFQNIYSLLKPNGDILLMFMESDNAIYHVFKQLSSSPKWEPYLKEIKWFYVTDDPLSFYENILLEVGFKNINCYKKSSKHFYNSWEEFIDLTNAVVPDIKKIPSNLKKDFYCELNNAFKCQKQFEFNEITGESKLQHNLIVFTAKK